MRYQSVFDSFVIDPFETSKPSCSSNSLCFLSGKLHLCRAPMKTTILIIQLVFFSNRKKIFVMD